MSADDAAPLAIPASTLFGHAVSVYDLTLRAATLLRELAEERMSVVRMQHALWCGDTPVGRPPTKAQMLTAIGVAMQAAISERIASASTSSN